MNICCLEHAPFEGPGNIADWATRRGHPFSRVRLYDGETLPDPRDLDLLVVMGGPMSVHDESTYPWLAPEKRLIRRCLAAGKFTLGVCLGSQLLAEALGSRVYRNRFKEIGWFAVERCHNGVQPLLFRSLPDRFNVFHWHGDTYDLPPDAIHLARSAACAVQAFEHSYALGLQFHLELTSLAISEIVRECAGDIGSGPYEQTPAQILAAAGECDGGGQLMREILDGIEARVEDSVLVTIITSPGLRSAVPWFDRRCF